MKDEHLTYIYPLPVRVWHWVNAAGFVVLIFTGLQIRYAEIVHLMTLQNAIAVHNYTGFLVIANFFIWIAYYLFLGNVKVYIPEPQGLGTLVLRQIKYYGYGLFIGKANPHVMNAEDKFNPLQKLTYLVTMLVLLPAQMMSGLLLWQIKKYDEYINLLGGLKLLDSIHVMLSFVFIAYLVIHCYLATLGTTPFTRFKAMFTGYEEIR